jgi:squalene-associated FAD-dependent desaturase
MAERVLIIGGGLTGLAAATVLAPCGFQVTLLESRNRLGGRASSFQDAATGQLIDACQHVSMGCCTNFSHFCRTVGIDHLLERQAHLFFMTADGRVSRFEAMRIPAPFHLASSFCRAHFLSVGEKLRIAWGLASLRKPIHHDPPFQEWLIAHHQTPRTVERFWGVVLTSALNETPDRIGLRYARKVFVDGFLRDRRGFEVELPQVPLGRLYGEELQHWLRAQEVKLIFNAAARRLHISGGRVQAVALRQADELSADWYISAVPFDRLVDLLPVEIANTEPYFANIKRLQSSPITSVHVWYDRAVLDLPHLVLIGCDGQWVFNRGESNPGEFYIQVVVSASRQFRGLGHDAVQQRIVSELARLFPKATPSALRRARVVTEHGATFSAVPNVDLLRPGQLSPIENLFVAGDWTATGWPATMEGAVRSGYLAAQVILARHGCPQALVQPDLHERATCPP